MHRILISILCGSVAFLSAGCAEEDPATRTPTTAEPANRVAEDHTDEHGGDGGIHGGPMHEIGEQTIAGYTVHVTQVGEVEPGGAATFEVVLSDGDADPAAVRAWVGNEQAIGSVKVRAVQREAFYDADLEVPDPMPEDSRFWVEIETANGERAAGSFDLHE